MRLLVTAVAVLGLSLGTFAIGQSPSAEAKQNCNFDNYPPEYSCQGGSGSRGGGYGDHFTINYDTGKYSDSGGYGGQGGGAGYHCAGNIYSSIDCVGR
jgi:hypothetical protein